MCHLFNITETYHLLTSVRNEYANNIEFNLSALTFIDITRIGVRRKTDIFLNYANNP